MRNHCAFPLWEPMKISGESPFSRELKIPGFSILINDSGSKNHLFFFSFWSKEKALNNSRTLLLEDVILNKHSSLLMKTNDLRVKNQQLYPTKGM